MGGREGVKCYDMVPDRGDRCLFTMWTCSFRVKFLISFSACYRNMNRRLQYFEIRRCGPNCSGRFSHIVLVKILTIFEFFASSVRKWRCGSNSERRFFNNIWSRGFLSCSGRVSIYAPNIRCANKLAHCKYEKFVWSALPNCKPIAYSFCWRERKRKYVSQWKMARSKWKWTSIAMVPDLCPTAVKILTHLISRYQLPLRTSEVFFSKKTSSLQCDEVETHAVMNLITFQWSTYQCCQTIPILVVLGFF
jgi:hypothetical protein